MRQSICQKQEELPAIALGNDMGKLVQEEKGWKKCNRNLVRWKDLGNQGKREQLQCTCGVTNNRPGRAAFYPTKVMLSHSPIMENGNKMG